MPEAGSFIRLRAVVARFATHLDQPWPVSLQGLSHVVELPVWHVELGTGLSHDQLNRRQVSVIEVRKQMVFDVIVECSNKLMATKLESLQAAIYDFAGVRTGRQK